MFQDVTRTQHLSCLSLITLMCWSVFANAASIWTYRQEADPLTNQTYSIANSPTPLRGPYDDIKMSLLCRDNKLSVGITAAALIASPNSEFEIEYQIDKLSPALLRMKTAPDSKRQGYADEDDGTKRLIDAILSGHDTLFIRIKTMLREQLSTAISLQEAGKAIQPVLKDCGLDNTKTADTDYLFTDFQRDFNQLPLEKQQHLLKNLKKIIMDVQ